MICAENHHKYVGKCPYCLTKLPAIPPGVIDISAKPTRMTDFPCGEVSFADEQGRLNVGFIEKARKIP